MVTKGIILSIDFAGNTCVVRMPLFETAGNDQITGTAAISNTPGSFNGYKVGDVVLVAFEDGQMAKPVILGKLYLGVEAEKADPRGVINVENLSTDKSATLPADTKLAAEIDPNVPNTTTPYSSLSSVANELNSLNTDFGQLNRFVNNQFKSIIEDSDGNQSIIDQLSDRINAKVSKESQDVTEGFGWELTNKSWILNTYKNGDIIPIFKAYNGGVEITNNLKLVGYPVNNVTRYARVRCEFQNIVINTADGVWLEVPPIYRKDRTTGAPIPDYTPENYENYKNGDPDKALILTNYLFDAETMPPFDDGWWVWQIDYATTYIYDEATDSLVDGIMNVVVAPIWYGNDSRLDSKPGGISRGPGGKEAAIGKIARDAKAIAQGKSTNYYSSIMPTKADYPNLRVEDCWFDTSENWVIADTVVDGANPSGQFDTRDKYNNYYIKNSDNSYTKIEPTTAGITPNSTVAYKCDTNVLKQCTGWNSNPSQVDRDGNPLPIWTDISGELVANKLTANYINAMDITAKKIEVLDSNNDTLFKANGINDGSADTDKVRLANFIVEKNKFYTQGKSTLTSTAEGVYIGNDGISVGSGFKVEAGGVGIAGYTKEIHKKYCRIKENIEATAASAHGWWDQWNPTTTESGVIRWQTAIPDRADDEYIWEWTKVEMGDDTTDPATWTDQGKICKTADSPYTLDIKNPFVGAPYSNDGSTSGWDTATFRNKTLHKLIAYCGNTKITDTITVRSSSQGPTANGFSIIPVATNVTITTGFPQYNSTDKLVESKLDTVSADNGSVEYTLYVNGTAVATATFEIVKNKVGEEGEPAVSYWISLTPDTVQATVDGSGTITSKSPANVSVEFDKQVGTGNPTKIVTGDNLYYTIKYDGGTESAKTKITANPTSITTSSFDSSAVITIYSNNTTSAVKCASNTVSVIKDGKPGSGGRGVVEVKTYYSLSNTTSADGPATGDSNIVDPPAVNKWSLKPQAFDPDTYTGYEYWTVTRTVYSDDTSVGVWGTPVKASMMDVDFINSLGITAKYLEVKENLNISGDGGLTATNATISGDLLATQLVLHDVQLFTKNETNRRAFTLSASVAVENKKVRVTATITSVDSGTITDHELIKAAVTFSYTGKATGAGNNKPVSGLWTATVELANGISSNSVLAQPTWAVIESGLAVIVNVNVETTTYISHTPTISYQATGDFVNYVGFFDDRYNLHTMTKLVDVQDTTRYYLKTRAFKGFRDINDRDEGSGSNLGLWYIENFDIEPASYTDSTMWLLVPILKSDFTSIETAELSLSSPNYDLLMRFTWWSTNNTGDTPRFVYSHIFGTGHAEDEAAKAATLDQNYYWLAFRVAGLPHIYSLSKDADTGEYSLTSTKKKFLMRLLANVAPITNTDVQWNLRLSVTGSRDPV